MISLRLTRPQSTIALVGFTIIVNLLSLQIPDFDLFKAVLGFIWLILLPGWLIIRLARLRFATTWTFLTYTTAFGILAVMLVAVITNTVLPLLGDPQPLDTVGLMAGFDIAWLLLIAAEGIRNRRSHILIKLPKPNYLGLGVAAAGLPMVALSILGAITLNNHGSNILTVIMLGYASVYLAVLVYLRNRLPESAMLTGLYQVALSLLLMTSLRGWYTTGHDVQREYRVFILALSNLNWKVSDLNDAYNACLSITILPTVFRQVLGINEQFVYKTVFQVLFAIVPVIVYLISQKHFTKIVSLIAFIYFVAFPTYFGDMTMLNRQEIAFVFLSLIFLTLSTHEWSVRRRRWLVGILGVGVVLSHYSTTYSMIALFIVVLGLKYALKLLAKLIRHPGRRSVLGLDRWQNAVTPLNFTLVAVLLATSYLWSTQLTKTGSNVTHVITETFASIGKGLVNDSKSGDTSYSLVGKTNLTDQQRLDAYIQMTVPTIRAQIGKDNLYPSSITDAYHPQIAPLANLPLTSFGQVLNNLGAPIVKLSALLHQGSAVFLQLMLLVGVAMLFFGRILKNKVDNEYRLLQVSGVVFLAAIILLPVLSAEYGLLRAFQQILMLGGSAVAIATIALIPKRFVRTANTLATALAIGFFMLSTGFITSIVGGYPAQLHLANSGKYYDLYYAHQSEQYAISWLSYVTGNPGSADQVSSSIESDRYTLGRLGQFSNLNIQGNIYPGTVPKDSYVFVGYTTLVNHTATTYYNGDPLTYVYPLDFLDNNKDLVYSNGGARVYR